MSIAILFLFLGLLLAVLSFIPWPRSSYVLAAAVLCLAIGDVLNSGFIH